MTITFFVEGLLTVLLFPATMNSYLYDYDVFENFEVTKDIFIKEQKLMRELEKIRIRLYQEKDNIAHNMNVLVMSKDFHDFVDAKFQHILLEKLGNFQIKKLLNDKSLQNNTNQSLLLINAEGENFAGAIDDLNLNYNIRVEF